MVKLQQRERKIRICWYLLKSCNMWFPSASVQPETMHAHLSPKPMFSCKACPIFPCRGPELNRHHLISSLRGRCSPNNSFTEQVATYFSSHGGVVITNAWQWVSLQYLSLLLQPCAPSLPSGSSLPSLCCPAFLQAPTKAISLSLGH